MDRTEYEWSDEEINILKNNYGKTLVKNICDMLPKRGYSSVRHMISKLELSKQFNLRRYNVNKESFKYYNSNSCYWAGFIGADGNITDSGRLSIGLKKEDSEHLVKFNNFLEYTNDVKIYKNTAYSAISCKEICDDLFNNFNITPRKSKTLKPPTKIKDNLDKLCFIKGIIDGDGSIDKKSITIYGTKCLLEWIKEIFDDSIPKTNRKVSIVRQIQPNLHAYKISGKRRDFMYSILKNLKCDKLNRKWN